MTIQQWKPGLVAAAALAIVTCLPQIYLSYSRGPNWNGSFASFDTDEFAYAAYVNALINGRPRRNDPYTDQNLGSFETLFSIQLVPAYATAIPARVFGVSASTAFIVLLPLVAIASMLVLFRILFEFTENQILSAVGAFAILCFGWVAASAPWVFFEPHVAFPFLRRYMPAFSFPFLLGLSLFAWRALTRQSVMWSALTGLSLAILIYSYFFLWTAAAAWLGVLMVLWLVARPQEKWNTIKVFGIIGVIGFVAFIPYAWLLTQRRPVMDEVLLMFQFTRRPDLFRGPEIYGAIMLPGLFRRDWRQPKNLFILSLALAPLVIFNQQILTGRSLQPFHYEHFVTNYWVLIGLFLFVASGWRIPNRVVAYAGIIALALGVGYGAIAAQGRYKTNVAVDQGRAAAKKLSGTGIVFASTRDINNSLAATASNPVLWSRYLMVFSNVSFEGQKRRFYQYLYYSGKSESDLRALLQQERESSRFEIFGVHRGNPNLAVNVQPITPAEIEAAVSEYGAFARAFSRADAASPELSYAIVSPTDDLSNLDKWYQRDDGERIEDLLVYRLRLK